MYINAQTDKLYNFQQENDEDSSKPPSFIYKIIFISLSILNIQTELTYILLVNFDSVSNGTGFQTNSMRLMCAPI